LAGVAIALVALLWSGSGEEVVDRRRAKAVLTFVVLLCGAWAAWVAGSDGLPAVPRFALAACVALIPIVKIWDDLLAEFRSPAAGVVLGPWLLWRSIPTGKRALVVVHLISAVLAGLGFYAVTSIALDLPWFAQLLLACLWAAVVLALDWNTMDHGSTVPALFMRAAWAMTIGLVLSESLILAVYDSAIDDHLVGVDPSLMERFEALDDLARQSTSIYFAVWGMRLIFVLMQMAPALLLYPPFSRTANRA